MDRNKKDFCPIFVSKNVDFLIADFDENMRLSMDFQREIGLKTKNPPKMNLTLKGNLCPYLHSTKQYQKRLS